jgi:perosamine synthetase
VNFPIVRGRFSHSLRNDIAALSYPLSLNQESDFVASYESQMKHFVGTDHCASFGFARTAFWTLLKALELPQESKVILPSITIKAMLDIVLHQGHIPIFVDTDPLTGSVDLDSLKKLVREEPKVILLTYLFGVVPNMTEIMSVLKDSSAYIVEDFSQCLNGEFDGKKIGTFGHASILSTSAVKTLDTYGGGLLFTNDSKLFEKVINIRHQFKDLSILGYLSKVILSFTKNLLTSRLLFPFLFLLIWISAKRNSGFLLRFVGARSKEPISTLPQKWFIKFSPWQARAGLSYLTRVKRNDEKRIAIAKEYGENFDFVGSAGIESSKSVYWQCVITNSDPQDLRLKLSRLGIDSAQTSLVLLSELPAYGWNFSDQNPGAKMLHENGVYIPLYHQLKQSEVSRIVHALNKE